MESIVGPFLKVVPFENSKILDAEWVGGLSQDGSIEGAKERRLFELGGYVSSEEEEEELVGFPLVL